MESVSYICHNSSRTFLFYALSHCCYSLFCLIALLPHPLLYCHVVVHALCAFCSRVVFDWFLLVRFSFVVVVLVGFFLVRFSANKYSNDFVYNKLEESLLFFYFYPLFFFLPELWATYAAYSPSNILSGCPPPPLSLSLFCLYCGISSYVFASNSNHLLLRCL